MWCYVCVIPFGESSFRDEPIGPTFPPRLADRTIFPFFFFVVCSLQPNCETLGVFSIKKWKTSAVITTDWIVETQLCKLRGTSDKFVGRACSIFHIPGIRYVIWCLWTKLTIWLLILSFTILRKVVRACSIFYPHGGYRSVTPLDAARVNRTIFHNYCIHMYTDTTSI